MQRRPRSRPKRECLISLQVSYYNEEQTLENRHVARVAEL